MAQDDGSLQAFCAKNNHLRELVNVPALVAEVYEAITTEVAAAVAGGYGAAQKYGPVEATLQAETKADDASIQHGASSESNSPSD